MSELSTGAHTALPGFDSDEASTPRLSVIWPLIVAGGILYGSLLPFRFDVASLRSTPWLSLLPSTLRFTTLDDVITNLIVYIPLGLAIVLCARLPRGAALLTRVMVATACGAALSVLAETLQRALPIRVSSLADVALNTIGTGIGAIVGAVLSIVITRTSSAWRTAWHTAPFGLFTAALTVGLLLFGLMPFDFVTDSASLHESFRRAQWSLTEIRPLSPGTPPFAPFAAQYAAAAWFALLGYLGARARRERSYTTTWAWAAAMKHGVTIVCLIEGMQLFTRSHQFDAASMVLRSLAVAFGAWVAVTADGWSVQREQSSRLPRIPVPVLVALTIGQLIALLLPSFDPALMTMANADIGTVGWLPFEALWHRSIGPASAELFGSLVVFVALAGTTAALLTGLRMRRIWSGTLISVTLAACSVEVMQLCTIGRHADITGPALAAFSVFLVARLPSIVAPARAAANVPQDARILRTATAPATTGA